MRPSIGQYVRVLHDFETCQKGEITVLAGDIIQIIDVVDDNWLCGRLSNVEGRFPSAFVEGVTLPDVKPGQKVFAAIDDFQAAQDGDLGICRGDIIEGLQQVDDNWWEGRNGDRTGIFPLTCVTELGEGPSPKAKQTQKPRSTANTSQPLFARALVDVTPQIDGELGFGAGDIITVTEVIDNDWYMGQFAGKEGLFSAVCVEIFEDTFSSESDAGHSTQNYVQDSKCDNRSENNESSIPSFSSENTRSYDTEITPYARTLYPFQGQSRDELSFMANEIVTLIQHADSGWIEGELDGKMGLFPASYVEIIVDCPYATGTSKPIENQTYELPESAPAAPKETPAPASEASADAAESCSIGSSDSDQFGLVLHDFQGEVDGDLNVREGDTVIIVQVLDDNWIQARDESGTVGLVPLNHVQVIGEGPRHASLDVSSAQNSETPVPASKENGVCPNQNVLKEKDSDNNNVKDYEKGKSEGVDEKLLTPQPVSEKPKTKPKLMPKPKLAPKPVIKPKPAVLAPKPFIKPSGMSTSLNVGRVSSPTEKHVFKGINTSKSLNSLIEEQLSSAKADADEANRSRSSSNKSSGSNSSGSSIKRQDSLPSNLRQTESVVHRPRPSSLVSDSSSRPGSDIFEDIANLDQLASRGNTEAAANFDFTSDASQHTSAPSVHPSANGPYQSNKDLSSSSTQSFKRKDADGYINNAYLRDVDDPHPHPARPPPPVPSFKGSRSNESRNKVPPGRAPPPRPSAPRPGQVARQSSLSSGTSKTHPVPQRPAPPVPKGPPKMPTRPSPPRPSMPSAPRRPPPRPPARTGSDLMSFSPERDIPDAEDEVNAEVVAELKSRIVEIQKDIQNYEKSCEELKLMLCQVGEEEREEIQETLDDQRANVQGLTEELGNLRQNLHQLCPAEQRKYEAELEAERRREDLKRKMEEEKKKQEEMKLKRREKREKVIQELMATEKDYLHDLHLCIDMFLGPTAEKVPGVDMEGLFGNIEEIADVSQRLLTSLEGCINGKTFEEQLIGEKCIVVPQGRRILNRFETSTGHNFVDFAEDMKNTYAPYCRNHDTVITVMEKYTDNIEVKDFFNRMIAKLREQINVFDLESLLIKPIQRILKYPLLLNELFKSTEDDHEDKQPIVKAINAMTDVATAINEYKRRKDLVYKYKKDTSDQRFSDKIAKLNFHSIRKKSSRMRGRLSTNLGLGLQTRDENFEREEVRFRHIEKAVRVFQKNVMTYMDQVQENAYKSPKEDVYSIDLKPLQECVGAEESLVADIVDLYDSHPSQELQKYRDVQEKKVTTLLVVFKGAVDDLVISPLSHLIQKFEGPNKVIEKRFDKLLDYDSQFRKAKDNEKNDALQMAKNDYEAMNAQLLDELPKLYSLTFKMLTDCMGAFTKAQKIFTDKSLKETYSLGQLPLLLHSDGGVMETFNVNHTTALDKVSMLCFIPRGFNPKMDSMKVDKKQKRMSMDQGGPSKPQPPAGSSSPQSDSQRVYLRQLYPAGKLYRVGYTYSAMDLMDLSLNEGLMVGVLKEQDPMGNKEKWFVDDGVKKGFVPKKILVPWATESVGGGSSPTGSLASLTMDEGLDLMGGDNMSDIVSVSSNVSQPSLYPSVSPIPTADTPPQPEQYYYAEFGFQSRGPSEVSLFEGQVVSVLTKADLEGNTEWWMVDADGQHGYAPANYLQPMS